MIAEYLVKQALLKDIQNSIIDAATPGNPAEVARLSALKRRLLDDNAALRNKAHLINLGNAYKLNRALGADTDKTIESDLRQRLDAARKNTEGDYYSNLSNQYYNNKLQQGKWKGQNMLETASNLRRLDGEADIWALKQYAKALDPGVRHRKTPSGANIQYYNEDTLPGWRSHDARNIPSPPSQGHIA